jgi:hypothetical protein
MSSDYFVTDVPDRSVILVFDACIQAFDGQARVALG